MDKSIWRALAILLATVVLCPPASAGAPSVRALFRPGGDRILVVAHRGCHNAAPAHRLDAAPENSLKALEHCVAMGADMVEIDIRRSADGELVVIHDATIDRTMNGTGAVSALTLADLRRLRLKQNQGGSAAAVTDEQIATLGEMLEAARGRVLLNLDVKEAVYAETIDAVLRAGMQDQVVLKARAGPRTRALARMAPFDRVPFVPILQSVGSGTDLAVAATRQMDDADPVAFELPETSPQQVRVVAAAVRPRKIPLWVNTLWGGFVAGWGGDADALRDPDGVWGRMYRAGVRIFQTDEPAALLAYRASLGASRSAGER